MSISRNRGFTLVELMISVVLGMVIVGGVISVMLANKRSFNTNEGLSQVQESARTAFELIARDVRQSAGNTCDNNGRTADVVDASGANWWQGWWGVRGVDDGDTDPAVATGGAVGERVAGTDSLRIQGMEGTGFGVDVHNAAGQTLTLQEDAGLVVGDIVMICDFDHTALFQTTAYDSAAFTLEHDNGGGPPGNCSSGLGFPTNCDGGTGNIYAFPQNSPVGRLAVSDWYVGNNGRAEEGGRSLYRRRLGPGGVLVTEEIVAGVTDMQVTYRRANSDLIQDASAVADWGDVNAILVELTADSASARVTTDATVNEGRIQRTFNFLITLRNRAP